MTYGTKGRRGWLAASFKVEHKPTVEKAFKQIPQKIQAKIQQAIAALASNPYPANATKKQCGCNIFGLSVGAYRVIYQIQSGTGTVQVLWVGHHQQDFHKSRFWKQLRATHC